MTETEEWDFDGENSVYESIKSATKSFVKYMRGQSSLKQSFAAIFLSILTDVLAGLFLGKLHETLLLLPGLIVLIPGAMSMRGNIFGALGSRLSTALHMGRIDFSIKSKYIRNNIYSSITLTIFTSIALGFIARALLAALGFASISVPQLVLISFIGGLLSGLILLALTFGIAFMAHRKKWDPDNVTSPMITALGDFFTIPLLMMSAYLVLGISSFYIMMMFVLIMAFAVVSIVLVFLGESSYEALVFREGSYRSIVLQSVIVMLFAGALSCVGGLLLESNLRLIATVPIIITLFPAFLEEGGNIGCILSSRLSTRLNDDQMEAKFKMDKNFKIDIANSYILSILVFPIVSILVFLIGSFIGIGGLSLVKLVYTATIAGLLLATMSIFLSFVISIVSFRYKINPDNVAIPLLTGLTDTLGIFTVLLVMQVFGVLVV